MAHNYTTASAGPARASSFSLTPLPFATAFKVFPLPFLCAESHNTFCMKLKRQQGILPGLKKTINKLKTTQTTKPKGILIRLERYLETTVQAAVKRNICICNGGVILQGS